MSNTVVFLIGAGVGAFVMYILVLSIPALIPESMLKRRQDEILRAQRVEQKEKAKKMEEMARKTVNYEHYKTIITQYDIDHDMTISLQGRLIDIKSDIKEHQRLRHLIKLVFGDWKPDEKPFWKYPDLCKFIHEVYELEPELPFVLEPGSIVPVIELIYMQESGLNAEELDKAPLPSMEEIHERFVPESRKFFEAQITDKKRADETADHCVERLENAIRVALGIVTPEEQAEAEDESSKKGKKKH